jgi:hypothetical protein
VLVSYLMVIKKLFLFDLPFLIDKHE